MTDQRSRRPVPRPGKRPGSGGGGRPKNTAPKRETETTYVPDQKAKFLNPYAFVPALPRAALPGPLREDAEPRGHDRLHKDCWTGSIAVTLTVRTPLLLLDTARAAAPESGPQEHRVYPVLTRRGRPYLPATSVKGMLRSAYEAVTGSRFGVFHSGDLPLGWRRTAGDALSMKPARVSDDGTALEECETSARLPYYDPEKRISYPDGSTPQHLDEVHVRTEKKGNTSTVTEIRKGPPPEGSEEWKRGYVCVTGNNASDKTDERVFLVGSSRGKTPIPITEDMRRRWDALMRSYGDAHDPEDIWKRDGAEDDPGKRLGNEPGKLGWSAHLWQRERAELRPGALCYFRRTRQNGTVVTSIYPVTVTRDIAAETPGEMLPDDLHPAPDYDRLSIADRVFGWVAPKGSSTRPAGYRGRVRIGPVECTADERQAVTVFEGDGLPLAVLSAPKPSQGRFYLSEVSDPARPVQARASKEEVYTTKGRKLRGRKVYWHHAAVADDPDYWNPSGSGSADPTQQPVDGKGHREYRRPRKPVEGDGVISGGRFVTRDEEQRDSQNRSVRGWVKPGTTFTFRVDVHDLDEIELGALVWLLRLPEDCFHRLGLGKPLGFGSVRLDIDPDATTLHSGEQWSAYYHLLSDPLPENDAASVLDRCAKAFEELLAQGEMPKIRDAFLAVARGRADLPVHYPRVRPAALRAGHLIPPDPRGLAYEWFSANERLEDKEIAKGHGQSLPDPTGAPFLVAYREKKNDSGNGRGR
ncbi:TIGR03986 family type III CRISPR-associated RAMP protein [Thermomonospora amylolytica]|uniref:TIGR03986 family type III CRISPR-associated RAMP protein n=1 Tax=Thermomonospora amylolytica TaxID=1411117 RepID=UPI000E6BB31C|nr:TIGR03986 family CRISPR-associated RAMP protein [Thermomonospora amylolytica]